MSEDIDALRKVVRDFDLGEVETVTGAAGGVLYRPRRSRASAGAFIGELCRRLSGTERVLPGNFLYYSDILSTPETVNRMGEIMATEFSAERPDFVLTMETKGIPVAFATANALGVPLVIARHSSKVYEGSAVNINYVSGSGNIETMSLSRRAVREKQRADLTGRRILLAEDMEINAEIMMDILSIEEAEVDHAENGRRALEMFSASPVGAYSAILMDVRMPEMDGLEAAAAIRALDRPDARTIPIIALTANAFDEDVQSSLQAGMNAHLTKPVESDSLFQTLGELIYASEHQD